MGMAEAALVKRDLNQMAYLSFSFQQANPVCVCVCVCACTEVHTLLIT